MVQLRIGKRTYDAIRDPSCPVCIHPARLQVEERILFNDTFPAIAEWVSDVEYEDIDGIRVGWPALSVAQLASHFRRKHCPVNAAMLHALTEERDQGMTQGYETLANRVVDQVVFAKQVVARGQERLTRGEIEPTVKETLSATKLLAQIEQASEQTRQADRSWVLEQAMEVYFAEARSIMTDEQWGRFSRALNINPTLRALTERAQNPDVVDAELVESESA